MSGHLVDRYSTHEVICESFDHWRQLALLPLVQASGRLSKVSGTTIEAEGLYAPIGAQCAIESAALKKVTDAEVIGFFDKKLILMSYAGIDGLSPGDRVHVVTSQSLGQLGDALIGRVIDGHALRCLDEYNV